MDEIKAAGTSGDHDQTGKRKPKTLLLALPLGLIIISLLIMFFSGSGFRKKTFDPPKSDLSVSVGINHSLKSLPLVIADRMEFFSREGITASLTMDSSAVPLLEKLSDGRLDIVCAPEQLLALRVLVRDDFLILTVLNRNRSQALIINTAWGVKSVPELKGRRIALKKGSASEYFLYRRLLYHGVDIKEVELVDMEPGMIYESLSAGAVDAAITWPPFTNRICRRLGDDALVVDAHMGRDMYWLLVADKAWCRSNMQAVESFLAALRAAFDFMENYPDEAISIGSDFFLFPADRVKKEWTIYHFGLELPQSLLFAMEQEAGWQMSRMNIPGPQPDFFELIEYRPLKRLMPEKVTIIH